MAGCDTTGGLCRRRCRCQDTNRLKPAAQASRPQYWRQSTPKHLEAVEAHQTAEAQPKKERDTRVVGSRKEQ